jgi:hypothetical protein
MKEIKRLLLIFGFVTLCIFSFIMIAWVFAVTGILLFGFSVVSIVCLMYLFYSAVKQEKWDIKHQYIYIYISVIVISNLIGYGVLYVVWPAIMGI